MKPLSAALDRLQAAHACGSQLVLLFDYDGTLVPIQEHPSQARLSPETRRLLERLTQRPGVRVGILSGRTVDELKEMVCLPAIFFVGTGGLELDLHGVRIVHPQAQQIARQIFRWFHRFEHVLLVYPGAWLERKPFGFTVHYRGVPAHLVEELRARVLDALQSLNGELRALDGPMAIEVTPDLGWHKGTAIQRIVRHLGTRPALVLYAGDAPNDADAFEAVNSLGGLTIGVGPQAPLDAGSSVADHVALARFLARLDERLDKGGSPRSVRPTNAVALHGFWRPFVPSSPL